MGSAGRVFLRRPLVAAIAALLLTGATPAATADRETAARFDMVREIEVIASILRNRNILDANPCFLRELLQQSPCLRSILHPRIGVP